MAARTITLYVTVDTRGRTDEEIADIVYGALIEGPFTSLDPLFIGITLPGEEE